ncbi:DUF1311 domain-containing protein [Xanthomonas campestris pv. raphani]|nr:DUF1311 domain-containing protein [Xanthomonas campestris pv. raphani]
MVTVKLLRLSCLLALCVLAACSGESSTPAQSTASASPNGSSAPASASPTDDVALAADAQPSSPQATQAQAAPGSSKPKGDSPLLRPSYEECITNAAGATPAMLDCISAEHEYQDARLNMVYKALIAKLDGTEQSKLRDQQRQWIADRDEKCYYDPDSGQAGRVDAAECRLDMTASRAAELESL